jgi:hypothetical protein
LWSHFQQKTSLGFFQKMLRRLRASNSKASHQVPPQPE